MLKLNDNLKISAQKPTRTTDRVGVHQVYLTKEDIPNNMRFALMETIDDDGVLWTLLGGIGNSNWEVAKSSVGSSFVTTVANGGIPKGTAINLGDSIGVVLQKLLSPYLPASLVRITLSPLLHPPVVEVGVNVPINSATLSWGPNSDGKNPVNVRLIGKLFHPSPIDLPRGTTSKTVSSIGGVVTSTSRKTEVWKLQAEDLTTSVINSVETKITWVTPIYFGGAPSIDPLNMDSMGLVKYIKLNVASSYVTPIETNDKLNYTYIIYEGVKLKDIKVPGGMSYLTAFDYTTENIRLNTGRLVPYNVYKSKAKGAFAEGLSLEINQ